MNNTVEHQRLVSEIILAVGSLPYARCWKAVNGVFRDLNSDRVVTVGVAGGADINGILNFMKIGIRLEIEVKTGKGKLSPQQKNYRDMIESFGGVYIEARSVEDALQGVTNAAAR